MVACGVAEPFGVGGRQHVVRGGAHAVRVPDRLRRRAQQLRVPVQRRALQAHHGVPQGLRARSYRVDFHRRGQGTY